MNKILISIITIFVTATVTIQAIPSGSTYNESAIQKIRITDTDIPEGFLYGQIPQFARSVLRNNPWELDRPAINKLTKNVYPNGDSAAIKKMHLSILAKKAHPFGDDIVCYIILYSDMHSARKEMEKLSEFNRNNSDRTILMMHGNLAVFLIVDDVDNYKYISEMQKKIEERINSI